MSQHGTERAVATVAWLRRRIAAGEWPVNSRIPTETELAQLMGVGRSTVREAVRALANLGMLETAPGRGTFVRSTSPVNSLLGEVIETHSLEHILQLRRALEVEGAQLAARNRTPEQLAAITASYESDAPLEERPRFLERGVVPGQFHFRIMEATGNPLFVEFYGGLMRGIRSSLDGGRVTHGASSERRRADHEGILRAIAEQDEVAAAHLAARHADHDLIVDDSDEAARPA